METTENMEVDKKLAMTLDYAKFSSALCIGTLVAILTMMKLEVIENYRGLYLAIALLIFSLYTSMVITLDVVSVLHDIKRIVKDNTIIVIRCSAGAYAIAILSIVLTILFT